MTCQGHASTQEGFPPQKSHFIALLDFASIWMTPYGQTATHSLTHSSMSHFDVTKTAPVRLSLIIAPSTGQASLQRPHCVQITGPSGP